MVKTYRIPYHSHIFEPRKVDKDFYLLFLLSCDRAFSRVQKKWKIMQNFLSNSMDKMVKIVLNFPGWFCNSRKCFYSKKYCKDNFCIAFSKGCYCRGGCWGLLSLTQHIKCPDGSVQIIASDNLSSAPGLHMAWTIPYQQEKGQTAGSWHLKTSFFIPVIIYCLLALFIFHLKHFAIQSTVKLGPLVLLAAFGTQSPRYCEI